MVGIDFRKRLTHPSSVLLHPERAWVRKMLCKSTNYPPPPIFCISGKRFGRTRTQDGAAPTKQDLPPFLDVSHDAPHPGQQSSSSGTSRGPLPAGYERFCAALDVTRPGSDCVWAAHAPEPGCAALRLDRTFFPFSFFQPAFVARTSRASACCDFAPATPAPTGPPRCGPEYTIRNRTPDADGYAVRLDFRWTRLRLCPTTLRRPPVQAVRHGGGQGRAARSVSNLLIAGQG